jgi:hypothetical protein
MNRAVGELQGAHQDVIDHRALLKVLMTSHWHNQGFKAGTLALTAVPLVLNNMGFICQ